MIPDDWSRRHFLTACGAASGWAAMGAGGLWAQEKTSTQTRPFHEDFSTGRLDPKKWYLPRRRWGKGNRGLIPENVLIERDRVDGKQQNVLVFRGQGDRHGGDRVGWGGRPDRVGGMAVTRRFFASGRYTIVFKIGSTEKTPEGPPDPTRPVGMVPAFWTYGYRWVGGNRQKKFDPKNPLYNPHMDVKGWGGVEYWSEIDFPEFGKKQNFDQGLFNTFLNVNHNSKLFDTSTVVDGKYHRAEMLWRTHRVPIEIRADQLSEQNGLWWVQDKSVPFESYRGNPLVKTDDGFAVCAGREVVYFLDGRRVGATTSFVPSMAAQLTLGVWFPHWGGAAPWSESRLSIASVSVRPLGDPGDCFGVLTGSLPDNFDVKGNPIKR